MQRVAGLLKPSRAGYLPRVANLPPGTSEALLVQQVAQALGPHVTAEELVRVA